MSYAIIRTGGKQFAVEEGQTLRVPTIDKKEGEKLEIETLVSGEGKDAKFGGGAIINATVVGHGRGDKVIVFKKKRRKQYKRKQGHRQGYTEIKNDTMELEEDDFRSLIFGFSFSKSKIQNLKSKIKIWHIRKV